MLHRLKILPEPGIPIHVGVSSKYLYKLKIKYTLIVFLWNVHTFQADKIVLSTLKIYVLNLVLAKFLYFHQGKLVLFSSL